MTMAYIMQKVNPLNPSSKLHLLLTCAGVLTTPMLKPTGRDNPIVVAAPAKISNLVHFVFSLCPIS